MAFSAKQQQAIEMLSQGNSLGNIASALQLSPSTLWRWRKKHDFAEAVLVVKIDTAQKSLSTLGGAVELAIQTLRELCGTLAAPPGIRLRAAEALLNAGMLEKQHTVAMLELKRIEREEAEVINATYTDESHQ